MTTKEKPNRNKKRKKESNLLPKLYPIDLGFEPSEQQVAIRKFLRGGSGNVFINAVAGSGKTSTLKLLSQFTPNALFLAFNTHIVNELKAKLPPAMDIRTNNSYGFKVLRENMAGKKVDVDQWKLAYLSEDAVTPLFCALPRYKIRSIGNMLANAVTMCMNTCTDFKKEENVRKMIDDYGVDLGNYEENLIPLIAPVIEKALSIFYSAGKISFAEQIWLPVYLGMKPKQFPEFILGDEQQDLNVAQIEMMRLAMGPNTRYIGVGDPCQPPGTMISVVAVKGHSKRKRVILSVPIESLKVGQSIVGYSEPDCYFPFNRKIKGITKRPYSGNLVVLSTEKSTTRYTPNHICFANFSSLRDKFVVYLMRKGNLFRVGRSRMSYNDSCMGCGAIRRAKAEGADSLWILSVFTSEQEACIEEQYCQSAFGIPDLTFVSQSSSANLTKNNLELFWRKVEKLDLESRAIKCLSFYNKEARYPIWTKETSNYFSLKRPIRIRACNLIDGCLVCPFDKSKSNHSKLSNWVKANISYEKYEGPVYSLSVSDNNLYIADGIVTSNCQAIYAFTGARADAYEFLVNSFECKELPLSVCYRCPHSHLELARKIVPHIQDRDNCPEGIVENISYDRLLKEGINPEAGDLIVSRLTAPLVIQCIWLIKNKKQARVRGRDIGKSLIKFCDDAMDRETDISKLSSAVEGYVERQKIKIAGRRDAEDKFQILDDKSEAVRTMLEGFNSPSYDAFKKDIESIFSDEHSSIWLSTVHKAKGLEAKNVFLFDSSVNKTKMPFVHPKQTEVQKGQEMNIKYVALTRAKEKLTIIQ